MWKFFSISILLKKFCVLFTKRSEKLLCLDIKTKWGDPADEILSVVIDTELNFNNRGPKAEALVKLYSKLFDQKHYHVWRN